MGVRICALTIFFCFLTSIGGLWASDTVEVLGVQLPTEKVVAGKTLKLNGVAYRKAMGFIKVYVVGLYLEKTTQDGQEVIESDQIKQLYFHYLTAKATVKKLQDGFRDAITRCNTAEMVAANLEDVDRYASWLDKDMQPGLTSVSTYLPGKGLTLEYQGQPRGTIENKAFIEMYYRYNFSDKANAKIRDGLLGK